MSSDDLSIENINNLNEKTFHQIYCNYFRALVTYAVQITNDDEIAKDIVQDVFSVLWERKITFITTSSFKAYLYNSVRNASLDNLRHRCVEEDYVEKMAASNPAYDSDERDSADYFYKEEVYRKLFRAIDELPERCREVFLKYMEGKKNEEIAEALHISIETVKTQKKRGMTVLRKKLSVREYMLLVNFLL